MLITTTFRTVYRIGNGRAGNVGLEALAHVAVASPGAFTWTTGVRNPLAAEGGVDAETLEETRQRAPQAFRADQLRAVTEQDWADAAERLPGVDGAVASFRWTASWYTIFVGIDPSDPDALVTDPVTGIKYTGLEITGLSGGLNGITNLTIQVSGATVQVNQASAGARLNWAGFTPTGQLPTFGMDDAVAHGSV